MRLGVMSSDFHRVEFGSRSPGRSPSPRAETPSDAVLVPLDQWDRLLGQLGNLHEAGQQLAEARERMARAETENSFLKERVRELRQEMEQLAGPPAAGPDPAPPEPDVIPSEETQVPDAAPPETTRPVEARRTVRVEMRLPSWMSRRRRR